MSSFNFTKFFRSFFTDEDIDEYTFFEESLPQSFINVAISNFTASHVGVDDNVPRLISFGQLEPEDLLNEVDAPDFDVDSYMENATHRTLLHFAVLQDNLELCQKLIQKGINVNAKDKDKRTALHYAIMHFRKEIIELLIQQEGIHLNATDFLRKTPLNTAFDKDSVDAHEALYKEDYIKIILEMVERGASLTIRDILDKTPMDMIIANGHAEELFLTAILIKHDFTWFEYLSRMKSPLRLVTKLMKHEDSSTNGLLSPQGKDASVFLFQSHDSRDASPTLNQQQPGDNNEEDDHSSLHFARKESALYRILETLLHRQDRNFLKVLVYFYINLEEACDNHLPEAEDLKFFSIKLSSMIYELFRCDSMDIPFNVQKILQPSVTLNPNEPLLLIQSKSFEPTNLLHYCMKKNLKFIFSLPQIGTFLDELFYSSLKREYLIGVEKIFDKGGKTNDVFFQSKVLSYHLRSCPLATFLLRFVSKLILLSLIAKISMDYSSDFHTDYSYTNRRRNFSVSEIWLLIFTILEVIYEIGQIIDDKWNFKKYFQGKRNVLEIFVLALIIFWSFLRIKSTSINTARVVLSLCAIPSAVNLLKFLSLWKPLGELVLILKWIGWEILTFSVLYIIFIIGFGITIFSLFHNNALFPTHGLMFLQMFEFTLNNFDFGIFDTNSVTVNTIGIIVLIIFLVLTAIVLFNLLIARLTNVHDRLITKALVEWSHTKAQLLSKNLLLTEMHPFKIIPPPFNILPFVFTPFHYYYWRQQEEIDETNKRNNLKKSISKRVKMDDNATFISLAGSIANLEYSVFLGGFIRIYGLIRYYLYRLSMKRRLTSTWSLRYIFKFVFVVFPLSFFVVLLRILTAFFTPLVQWEQAVEKIDKNGNFGFMMKADNVGLSRKNTMKSRTPTLTIDPNNPPNNNNLINSPPLSSNQTSEKDDGKEDTELLNIQ
jgi:ankyrin repeat protein